jgi:transcriptional regulator with XRE-family HTH domain
MIYYNNEQLVTELKKTMLESKTSQKRIADQLGIKPQSLTNLLNKKNFSFEDARKILAIMGYKLAFDFIPDDRSE